VRRRISTLAVLAVVAFGVAACGGSDRPKLAPAPVAQPATTTTAFPMHQVATVRPDLKSVAVYPEPGAPAPKASLSNPTQYNVPRVFLVARQEPDWLLVDLPTRPNESKGWIKASDVTVAENPWRIRVDLAAHKVTVWNGADVVHSEPAAVGKATTPTPTGRFYITENLTVPSFQYAAYGPFAFGLSAHSNVYTSFGGGDGQVGMHGTGSPSSIGKATSNGCIRLSNEGITKLIKIVPPGTPIEIV
jgi:lipoprotein-anchoring transpeptidase ErfK/SrfK